MDLDFEIKRIPRGDIASNYFPTLLFAFLDQRLTGRVTFNHNESKIDLLFRDGDIVGSRSNNMAHRLGEILLIHGRISVKDYEASVQMMLEDGMRQGDALIQLGALKEDDLTWAVAKQSKEILYTLFDWPQMEYKVKNAAVADDNLFHLSTHEVVLRGLKRIQDWPRIRNELFPYRQIFAINQTIRMDDARKIRIKSDEEAVLSLIDGNRTVEEVFAASPQSGYSTARLLYAFKWARIIRLRLVDDV